jgi:hypothetical protein
LPTRSGYSLRKSVWRSWIALPVFVLAVFAKNEKADLSRAERNALAKMITEMIEGYRRRE